MRQYKSDVALSTPTLFAFHRHNRDADSAFVLCSMERVVLTSGNYLKRDTVVLHDLRSGTPQVMQNSSTMPALAQHERNVVLLVFHGGKAVFPSL